MGPYIQMARPLNCVMSAVAVVLGGMLSVGPEIFQLESVVSISLAAAAVTLFVAAGNTLNDYEDRYIDIKAHPRRPIPSGRVAPSTARLLAYSLFTFSAVVGITIDVHTPVPFLFLLINMAVMISYEKKLKGQGIPGNLAISWLTASLFLFGALSVGTINPTIIYFTAMAFLSIFMREIAKDIEDADADRGVRQTAPIIFGEKPCTRLATLSLLSAIILSPMPWLFSLVSQSYIYIVAAADVIFIYSIILLFRGDARRSQNVAKLGMLVSLVAFAFGVFI